MEQQHTVTPKPSATEEKRSGEWYYLIGEEHFGPISTENLRKAITSGQLSKETHVFREGLSDWLHASQCHELCAVPVVKLPAAPTVSTNQLNAKQPWVLWWPQSVVGNILLGGAVIWQVLNFLRWGNFQGAIIGLTILYVLFVAGRLVTARIRNSVVSLPRYAFASIRTLVHLRQVRRGLSLGAFLASLVFALWMTNQLQELNTRKRELVSSASETQAQLEHLNSSEYKQNLLAEGMIRAAGGDENGIVNRVAQENEKAESSMARAKDLTWDLRIVTEQFERLKTARVYSFVLGGLSLLCCILAFVLPTHRSSLV